MRAIVALGVAALAAGGAGLAPGRAAAQAPGSGPPAAPVGIEAQKVMQARKAGFNLMAGSLIGMKQAVDSGSDVKPLVDAVKALASWGHVIPVMFPPGTNMEGTKARPEVWGDRPGFEKAAANFVAEAQKLADMAEANDKSGFGRQYTATTQACGACHRSYRVRTN